MEASGARVEATGGLTGSTELARNALGLPAILFCIVTGSAPLAAMMFNDPLCGLRHRHRRPGRLLARDRSRSRSSPSPTSRWRAA